MPTSTQTKNGTPSFEAAFEQVRDVNEQIVAATRKAGTMYLDSYEKAVDRAIELEQSVAELTQQEWLKNLIEAHVDATRELTSSYTTTARTLLG
jgi:chemotaxis regulatin CheY-phosphate phosphatase CheZ